MLTGKTKMKQLSYKCIIIYKIIVCNFGFNKNMITESFVSDNPYEIPQIRKSPFFC